MKSVITITTSGEISLSVTNTGYHRTTIIYHTTGQSGKELWANSSSEVYAKRSGNTVELTLPNYYGVEGRTYDLGVLPETMRPGREIVAYANLGLEIYPMNFWSFSKFYVAGYDFTNGEKDADHIYKGAHYARFVFELEEPVGYDIEITPMYANGNTINGQTDKDGNKFYYTNNNFLPFVIPAGTKSVMETIMSSYTTSGKTYYLAVEVKGKGVEHEQLKTMTVIVD